MAGNEVRILINANDQASDKFGAVKKAALGLALGVGAAAIGAGVAATAMAADFDRGMREVNTLIGLPEAGLKSLKDATLDLSQEMGIAANQAVPALYQAISAGVPQDNVMEFMRVASKAAIGGVTDLETAVDGITSVVNAYGAEAMEAGRASDVMFTAVKLGKTDFEQLSASLFNVIPTAASLGVQFEEVAAALAVMTAQGTPTSVATTQLRQLFVEASKEGTNLEKAIRDLTGKGLTELTAEGQNVSTVLDMVRQSLGDEAFRNMFGSVEALNAALAITGPNAEGMAGAFDEMVNSAGATDAAFEEMEKSASRAWDRIKVTLNVGMIRLGSLVLPYVDRALRAVGDAMVKVGPAAEAIGRGIQTFIGDVKWLIENGGGLADIVPGEEAATIWQKLAVSVAEFVAAARPIVTEFIENLMQLYGVVMPALMAAFDAVVPVLVSVLGWLNEHRVVAAVLATAIGLLVAPWLAVIGVVIAVIAYWDTLTGALGRFIESVRSAVLPTLTEARDKFMNDVLPALQNVAKFVTVVLAVMFAPLLIALKTVVDVFRENWDEILELLKAVFRLILQVAETGIEFVRDVISVALALLRGDWDGAWNGMKTLISNVWENIKETVGAAVDVIIETVRTAWETIKGIVKSITDTITSIPTPGDIIDGARGAIGGLNPFRAAGGPVAAGASYIVGENRPELFRSAGSGTIFPSIAGNGGGGGQSVIFAPAFYGPVSSRRGAEDWLVEAWETAVRHKRIRLA